MIVYFSRERLVSVLREWREEWDLSPNQFLISEGFRQSDPQSYAEHVADYLIEKLAPADAARVDAEGGLK